MYKMAFKQYRMMIWYKKHSYSERKQKELHCLHKSDP